MTDVSQRCPGCGGVVNHFQNYIFQPAENQRWHARCYLAANPLPADLTTDMEGPR